MAKASLKKVTKEWIEGKKQKNNKSKEQKNKNLKKQKNKNIKTKKNKLSGKKLSRTFQLADEAYRLLMYHKADTGESMSDTIGRLVLKNLSKT